MWDILLFISHLTAPCHVKTLFFPAEAPTYILLRDETFMALIKVKYTPKSTEIYAQMSVTAA
jgi:hypothetical protein